MPKTRIGQELLLALLVILGISATGLLGGSDASWFPQEHAEEFYIVKGLTGMVAVVLTLVHMSQAWETIETTGQRLRYLALLMVTCLIASSSTQQIDEHIAVSGRNVGGLLAAVLVIVAMVVSIRQDPNRRDR